MVGYNPLINYVVKKIRKKMTIRNAIKLTLAFTMTPWLSIPINLVI